MASTKNQGPDRREQADEGVLSGMATTVKDKAQGIASAAEDAWDSTREGVQHAASAVANTAGDAWGEVTGLMRRYPFGTLFVGIGVGFLLSRLLEDRSTRDFRRLGSELYDRVRDYASDVASKLHA
jgi:ElaB/YqjD/DUF883 family membrane-anchored ribosome-binding protein